MTAAREELSRFFGKLATLVSAGVPLLEAFDKSAAGVESRPLREGLARVLGRAYGGSSLTDAFVAEEGLLAPEVVALVEHGERMGDLDRKALAVCRGLAEGVLDAPEPAGPEDRHLRDLVAVGGEALLLERSVGRIRIRIRAGGAWRDEAPPPGADPERLFAAARADAGARVCPTAEGEDVLLLLGRDEGADLPGCGLPEETVARIRGWLASPEGLVVVADLPGRRRERLLGALLRAVDREARKTGRVGAGGADVPGVRRYPVEARALYPDLAHLDVLLLPEPTARAEAEAAAGAALSGTLVLVPVTAETGAAAIERLRAAGFPPGALGAALLGVVERPVSGRS